MNRFQVLNGDKFTDEELEEKYPEVLDCVEGCDSWTRKYYKFLVDTNDDTIIWIDRDSMDCPEDMFLHRDLSVFVDALNKVANENA